MQNRLGEQVMNKLALEKDRPEFKIGSVSRLTGIPTDTLRIWERRYKVVSPERGSSGTRLYKHSDISRLAIIKQLVDQGNAISTVAKLSQAELEKRVQLHSHQQMNVNENSLNTPCRLVLCGDTLPLFIQNHAAELDDAEVVAEFQSPFVALDELPKLEADVLLMEFPTFQEDNIGPLQSILKRCPNLSPILVYGFSTRAALSLLNKLKINTVRAPLDCYRLKAEYRKLLNKPQHGPFYSQMESLDEIPRRKFTQQQLMKLNNLSVGVQCECPRHHVDILYNLYAFEDYSLECEIKFPEDAALHSYLYACTSKARYMMEQSLQKLIETDKLPINN